MAECYINPVLICTGLMVFNIDGVNVIVIVRIFTS